MANTLQKVKSALVLVFMAFVTVILTLAMILGAPFSMRWRYGINSLWSKIFLWALRVFCGLKYQIEGMENVPDKPVIIFSKHQSTYETILYPAIFDNLAWILKRELFWIPFFGWSLWLMRPIAINRKAGSRAVEQIVQQGTQYLEENRWVLIFPEGTRMKPGAKPNYRIGGAMLASRSEYSILPIAHNAGEFWPRHSLTKWSGTISFVVGPLIESKGKTPGEVNKLAEQWIEEKMQEISDPARWNR